MSNKNKYKTVEKAIINSTYAKEGKKCLKK